MIKHYVGQGFRQLSDDEIVEQGDEGWYPAKDKWVPMGPMEAELTASVMMVVSPLTAFRRPANTDRQIPIFDSFDSDDDLCE